MSASQTIVPVDVIHVKGLSLDRLMQGFGHLDSIMLYEDPDWMRFHPRNQQSFGNGLHPDEPGTACTNCCEVSGH